MKIGMDKAELKKELRKRMNNKSLGLPEHLGMDLHNRILTLTIHNVSDNMQADSAAFEGWALALKANLDCIESVVLDIGHDVELSSQEQPHIRRFLWRALNFASMYEWVRIGNFHAKAVGLENTISEASKLLVNQPGKSRTQPQNSKGEVFIEWQFVNQYQSDLCHKTGCDTLVNQFPVGVFTESVLKENMLFNGSKSAIDIVGLEGTDIVHLFELKSDNNHKVGVISEFLFYAFVLRELFITRRFTFGDKVLNRDFEPFMGVQAKRIAGHLLVKDLHPLLNDATMKLINDGIGPKDISLDVIKYQRDASGIIQIL